MLDEKNVLRTNQKDQIGSIAVISFIVGSFFIALSALLLMSSTWDDITLASIVIFFGLLIQIIGFSVFASKPKI